MQYDQRGPSEQHRQREPGLVAFKDIRPGNGTGLFFFNPGVHTVPTPRIPYGTRRAERYINSL